MIKYDDTRANYKDSIEWGNNDVMSNIRYTINCGKGKTMGFSAPYANTRQELGKLLVEFGEMLQADSKLVIGECQQCWSFILEGGGHVCK